VRWTRSRAWEILAVLETTDWSRDVRGLSATGMFGVLLATFVIGLALGVLFRLTLRGLGIALLPPHVDVGDELARTLSIGTAIVGLRYWTRQTWRSLVPLSTWHVRFYLPLLVSAMGLALLTAALRTGVLAVVSESHPVRGGLRTSASVVLFSTLILAPFTEELLMRGAVLGGLLRRYSSRKAILISALAFAVLHLSPYQFLQSLVLGLISGWVRVKTGSLWPGIVAHAACNAFLILGAEVFDAGVSALLGTVSLLLGLLWIRWQRPPGESRAGIGN